MFILDIIKETSTMAQALLSRPFIRINVSDIECCATRRQQQQDSEDTTDFAQTKPKEEKSL